jgi:hypothetical protein
MEVQMESLMLLGGQFLQARVRDEYRRGVVAAQRERIYWEGLSEHSCDVRAGRTFAARLLAAALVLGVLFIGLTAVTPADTGTASLASR